MAYQFHRICIEVVEDNQPMQELIKSLLITFGVGQIVTAKNGEEGFDRYCESNPDMIIADWMMKPVDGISFTRMVRTNARSPNQYVPIVLMTGFSEKRRVVQARDAGVTEFLVKPFNARDLYRRISQVIERPRQFVRSEDFFGPDRRRKRTRDHQGPFRREEDFMNPELARFRLEEQKKARETVEQIRQKAGLEKGDKFDLKEGSFDLALQDRNDENSGNPEQ